jgi:glutaredoxin
MEETARDILKKFDQFGLTRLRAADLIGPAQDGSAGEAVLASLAEQKYLRESFGQYERTEAGRLEAAEDSDLTLLSRSGCHLCEEALRELEPITARFGIRLRVVDIDTDSVLRERYHTEIPVIFLGKRELARHRVDRRQIQNELSRLRKR